MRKLLYPEIVGEMAKRGDTEKTLGKLLKISYGSVSRRLCGRTKWTMEEVNKLCDRYGKTYDELFKKGK